MAKIVGKNVPQNRIGPIVRKIRYGKGWTQAMLAARCSRVGWDIGENTISKIEAQVRCVTDTEIIYLAQALKTVEQELFPAPR
jgi:transcriptional regulator with XRE-family HTH domain